MNQEPDVCFQNYAPTGLPFFLDPAVGDEGSSETPWFGKILWFSIDQGSNVLQQKQFYMKSFAVSISVGPQSNRCHTH